MGADRKGPLAAFIVVAIIAAILLITSVRSQAATGWLDRALPSTPGVVRAVGGGLDQVVGHGAALVLQTPPAVSSGSHGVSARRVPRHPSAGPSSNPPTAPSAPALRHGHHGGWTQVRHRRSEHGHAEQGHPEHGHHDHGRRVGQHR